MKACLPLDPFVETVHAELLTKADAERRPWAANQRATDAARNAAVRNPHSQHR